MTSWKGLQMTDRAPRRPPDPRWIYLLVALITILSVVGNSDLENAVRYGVGGLLILALLAVVYQLRRSRDRETKPHAAQTLEK